MNIWSFSAFVLVLPGVFAGRNSPCITPNGENATCVPIGSCPVIVEALFSGNSTAADFANESHCGQDTEKLVCCGSTGFPIPKDFFPLFDPPSTPPPPPPTLSTRVTKAEQEAEILANFKTKELPDRTVCGLEKNARRIIGGEQTEIDELPWVAALEYKSKLTGENAGIRCGGSVINNRYVLTAAHCIKHIEFEIVHVRLGEWKLSTDPDCQTFIANTECADKIQKLKIKQAIMHPFYSKSSGKNDIGLLRLESDIRYTGYIRPICLPPQTLPDPEVGIYVTVAGWGTTEHATSSDIKLRVRVPILPVEECSRKLKLRSVSLDHLCAGGERGKDSCQGDSGGPLMRTYEDIVTQQNQWYQEGIVSWGIGCGSAGSPAIYTRVSRYIVWILNHITDD